MTHHPATPRGPARRFLLEPDWPLRAAGGLAHHALSILVPLALTAGGLALIVTAGVLLVRAVQSRVLARGARLIRIGVPPEVQESGGELLWSALHDLLRPRVARLLAGQPHLSWEVTASEHGTSFQVWVPRAIPPGLVERAISAAWPGASTEPADPAEHESSGWGAARVTCELSFSGPGWFSLDSSMDPDPLPMILGQLSGLTGSENALIQVIARPASSRERHRLRDAARRIRKGEPTSRLLRLTQILQVRRTIPPRLDPTITPEVSEAMVKSASSLYRCTIRVSVGAPNRRNARGRLDAVLGAFAPYDGAQVFLRRRHVTSSRRKLRERWLARSAFLLSVDELAALAHLPAQTAIPGLLISGAREIAPPPGLPPQGKPLGHSTNDRQVNLAVEDARQHLHVLGPTGVGKSTLIGRLALSDLEAGRGAVVIDPKGDLIEDLLARIPDGRENDVDLLDPLDEAPPGLNVLDSPDRDLGVDQLVGIFRRVFERDWGARTDDIFRSVLLTLTAEPNATLLDVPKLLGDPRWRAELLAHVDDQAGLGSFWEWYDGLSESVRTQAIGPLLNKLRAFLLRAPVRNILSQTSTIDIPGCLDTGRLLLVKLSKGTLGEDTSRLLGSMVVAKTWQAALARAASAPEQRRDAALYVDEVQNYLTLPTPIPDMLAEARGYRLSLCMAHQHLAQLTPELREGITANAHTKLYFQLSSDDAASLERQVQPELAAHDLAHLPRHTAAARLCHHGQTSRAFTLKTQDLPPATPGRAHSIRTAIRARYHTQREQAKAQRDKPRGQPPSMHRSKRPPTPTPPSVLASTLSTTVPSDYTE
jgi:TraM recognition site of TraD and TraG/Helicase HerA, central domain